jgi:type II secretion system protein N
VNERLVALRELAKRLLPKVGYPIVYLFCLLLFASWTFPYGRLKDRIVGSFNAQQRMAGSRNELEIDDMGSSFVTGVKMKGVRLIGAPTETDKPPSEMKIEEMSARIALLPLLWGNHDLSFHLAGFGGKIDGSFDDHGEKEKDVSITVSSLDVGQLTPLVELIGLPLEGTLSGSLNIVMPEGKASKASGSVTLETEGLAVGDGKAKLKGALALPRVSVGTLSLAGEAKDGILKITKLGAAGKDVEIQGDGRVQLREAALESHCDLNIKFKINDAYRTKSDITKSLFGAPGSNAPALFELADPRVKQSKRPDGFYGWHARGALAHLDFAPAAQGPAALPFAPGGQQPGAPRGP